MLGDAAFHVDGHRHVLSQRGGQVSRLDAEHCAVDGLDIGKGQEDPGGRPREPLPAERPEPDARDHQQEGRDEAYHRRPAGRRLLDADSLEEAIVLPHHGLD